jgi:hypothetical protein
MRIILAAFRKVLPLKAATASGVPIQKFKLADLNKSATITTT